MRQMIQKCETWSRGEVFAAIVLALSFLSVIVPAAIECSYQPPTLIHLHLD